MKFLTKILFLSLGILALASCSSNDDDKDSPDEQQTYRRSVIIYLAAQNSLGYAEPGWASASYLDSLDIMKGVSKLSSTNDNVFLFIDDEKHPRLSRIYRYGGKGQLRTMTSLLKTWSLDICSSDPATLYEVLSYVNTNYPSESYGLVLWSHGSGWQLSTNVQNTLKDKFATKSFGIDVGFNGDMENDTNSRGRMGIQMDIADMATAIAKSGIYLDYIFFDACFMQCVEAVYALRNAVKWCIGSPAEIPGAGAPYAEIMADLFLEPDEIWHVAEDYYMHYPKYSGVVLSVAKTSEMEALAEATAQLLSARSDYPVNNYLQRYNPNPDITTWKPEYFDMGSAMAQWYADSDYQTWRQAMEQAIPYRYAPESWLSNMKGYSTYPDIIDPEHIAAMSMYIPVPGRSMNEYYTQTEWWKRMKTL